MKLPPLLLIYLLFGVLTIHGQQSPDDPKKTAGYSNIIEPSVNKTEEIVPLEIEKIQPVKVLKRRNLLFADFGKDAYGNLEITFAGTPPLNTLIVRLGEKLDDKGAIDRTPPGSVSFREITLVTHPNQYIYKVEIPVKPRHLNPEAVRPKVETGEIAPFRYAEVEGMGIDAGKLSLRQLAVHAPFDESLSSFESSDPTLNAVWALCKQTMKATTAFGVFIDGEREHIPYEADAYINQLSFAAYDPNPRLIRATFDRLMDHPTWPTEWGMHMPMIAAADYMMTGEPAIALKHYEELKSRLLSRQTNDDGLLVAGAIVDWPAVERDNYNNGVPDPERKQQVGPEINTVANAFYCHALDQMALLADALGKQEDCSNFMSREKVAREAFNRTFLDQKTGLYVDGEGSSHSSLHANMFPLAFGLVPKERIAGIAAFVKSRGMGCSVYGAQYLLESLFVSGYDREAIALMSAHTPRSWWHMIDSGSTMTWEAWDPSVKPNLTWNHAWGSSPANILSRFVLGVRPLSPGYARILVAPQPGSLAWVSGTIPTRLGPVVLKVGNGEVFRLEIEIPAEAVATALLPVRGQGQIVMDGRPAAATKSGNICSVDISSGRHLLESR